MIISRITEGLGNQLFQYAAGRSLSLRHQVPLVLDISHYDRTTKRRFELAYFNIPGPHTDTGIYSSAPFNVYQEVYFHYDPAFGEIEIPAYLNGFWQSEQYFREYEPVIRKELTLKNSIVSHLSAINHEINSTPAVAVHVRRGDYLRPNFLARHGVMPVAYYQQAIRLLTEKFGSIHCYFFSDDIEWVKNEMFVTCPHTFVSGHHTKEAIEDFYLMSRCRHHIIANSSFSWWTAWLADHPEKMVIAPRNWFQGFKADTKDLLPSNWIRL